MTVQGSPDERPPIISSQTLKKKSKGYSSGENTNLASEHDISKSLTQYKKEGKDKQKLKNDGQNISS